ncbi:MAG: hypothetical protein AAFZ15_31130 [Bacteroidota bacterium]
MRYFTLIKWALLLAALTLFPLMASSQMTFDFHLVAQAGWSGLEKDKPIVDTPFEETRERVPGLNATLGVECKAFFKDRDRWSVNAGILYNYASFETHYESNGVILTAMAKDTSRAFNIKLPLSLSFHLRRLSFSAGIVANYHLLTEVRRGLQTRIVTDVGEQLFESYVVFNDKDRNDYDFGIYDEVFVERRFDLQYNFRLSYQVQERLTLGIEYFDYFRDNFMVQRGKYSNPGNYQFEFFRTFSNSLSLSVYWRMFSL